AELRYPRILEADGEALDAIPQDFAHVPGHEGGVDAAGEEDAEGDVGDEVRAHGLTHRRVEALHPLIEGLALVRLEAEIPVAARDGRAAVEIDDEVMGRRELLYPAKDGVRRGDVLIAEVEIDGGEVALARSADGPEGVDLGGEGEQAFFLPVVQGLDAEM